MRICDFPGCGRKHCCKGWCSSHYWQSRAGNGMTPIAANPSEAVRKGRASMTPEQRREVSKKANAALTPQQRRERALKANAALTSEQRSEIARKAKAALTPEQRSEVSKKANEARWGGDYVGKPVSYGSAHGRVEAQKGRASEHACVADGCDSRAEHWAYDHADPDEMFQEGKGWYSENPDHYRPLCVPCHRAYDAERERRDA